MQTLELPREIHLELLLGKRVFDMEGTCVGRIEEVRAEQQDGEWLIVEYWVGIAAIMERLSAWSVGTGLLHLFGARKLHKSYRIPWDKLDLSDLDRPCLTCPISELSTFSS